MGSLDQLQLWFCGRFPFDVDVVVVHPMLIQVLCRGNTRYMVGRDGRQAYTLLTIFFLLQLFYSPLYFFSKFCWHYFFRVVLFSLYFVDAWIHLLFLLTFSLHHTFFSIFALLTFFLLVGFQHFCRITVELFVLSLHLHFALLFSLDSPF